MTPFTMGEEERTQYDRVRGAKSRLYYPPAPPKLPAPEPPPKYTFRQTRGHEAWAVFMRRSGAEPQRLQFGDILAAVCKHFEVSKEDVLSDRRNRTLVLPRHITAHLAKKLTRLSLPSIGKRLGNRDHTTILYADRKIAKLVQDCPDIAQTVFGILRKLGRPYG